jgi:probable HAF family extracellular repeat protein
LPDTGPSQTGRAFLYSFGAVAELGNGTVPCYATFGDGMNNLGDVVGSLTSAASSSDCEGPSPLITYTHALLYSGGAVTDLGTLSGTYNYSSYATAINDAGQVVGYSDSATGAPGQPEIGSHAFVYSNGSMTDLNSLVDPRSPLGQYVTLTAATAINNYGVIVANGIDSRTGDTNAYVLTPGSM